MTAPTPHPDQPAHLPRPPKLAFIIVPLTVFLVWNAIELLILPFNGEATIRESYKLASSVLGGSVPPLTTEQIRLTLWFTFAFLYLLILWLYNTRRGLLEGKRWGRTSAIVLGLLSLLAVPPLGTVLGIFMLIGAFDRDVTRYASK